MKFFKLFELTSQELDIARANGPRERTDGARTNGPRERIDDKEPRTSKWFF